MEKYLKIAFVNDTFLEGRGADTVIYELARRLGKKHKVFVIATETDMAEENFKILKINGKKLLTGKTLTDSLSYFPNIMKIKKEILNLHKKYDFDIINLHHSSLNLAFKRFPVPVIVTWHGSPPSKNFLRKSLNKSVLKTLKRNKKSIAISDYIKLELSKYISRGKIIRIYNGLSEEFKPKALKLEKTRTKLKTKITDKDYMLYVGRLEPHKSVYELIKLSKETNFTFHMIGSGPEEKKLKNYAKRINANKVKFLGKVSKKELINQYQECSFFISASRWEGFGLIFVEAAACAKPSIGYEKGSVPEVIQNNKTGFTVINYQELKQKAETLITDKKLRMQMGKEALKQSKNFSWDKTAKDYEKLFNSLR